MSICIEQSNFENNTNNFSQDLSINEKTLAPKRIFSAKTSLFTQMRFWIELARQRKDLARLDKRMLADIGYTTEQAKIEASKPFWK